VEGGNSSELCSASTEVQTTRMSDGDLYQLRGRIVVWTKPWWSLTSLLPPSLSPYGRPCNLPLSLFRL